MLMKFVAEFQNNGKVLDLEGTLEIDYLVKLSCFTIDKTKISKKLSNLPKDIH